MSTFVETIGLIGIIFLCTGFAPDVEAKKKQCKPPTQFAYELNYDWVMGHSPWYFPLLSKQDLVRQSGDILKKKLTEIQEKDRPTACLQALWEGLTPVISGFGKKTSYELSPLDFTNFNILGFEKAWEKGMPGTLYITHTDNKNFVVFVRCWEDGEKTWNVMTTKAKLSEDVKKQILDHVKLLGFSKDDIDTINYDECSTQKTEL